MNYDKSPNETETLSADHQRLSEMCRSLKKVEAPKDFEFKLKARLADRKTSGFQPRLSPAFRYALPALALILVFGLLAYTGGFLSSNNNPLIAESAETPHNPSLSETAPQNSPLPQTAAAEKFAPPADNVNISPAAVPAGQDLPKAPERELAVRQKPKKSAAGRLREADNDNTNSALRSIRNAPVLELRGFDQKTATAPQNPQTSVKPYPLPVKDVLSIMGINADLEAGRWTVKSVTSNSVGDNSNVKTGDVIEAIDDQSLSNGTVFDKNVKGKTLTVTRGGEKLQINLRTRQ